MPLSPHLLILLLIYLLGFYLMWRIRSFARCMTALTRGRKDVMADPNGRRVSIIIPARNEGQRIGPLLESLGKQTLPALEVLVVDDHSNDGTDEVARALGAVVMASEGLPTGWTGKTWACRQGAQRCRSSPSATTGRGCWHCSSRGGGSPMKR